MVGTMTRAGLYRPSLAPATPPVGAAIMITT
jgi:hypothetical protein